MVTNLPKESSSATIAVENEPPCKKQCSTACYLVETTKIPVPEKSLEANKSKNNQRKLNASITDSWKSTSLAITMDMSSWS